jgi:hypothetical protein
MPHVANSPTLRQRQMANRTEIRHAQSVAASLPRQFLLQDGKVRFLLVVPVELFLALIALLALSLSRGPWRRRGGQEEKPSEGQLSFPQRLWCRRQGRQQEATLALPAALEVTSQEEGFQESAAEEGF